MTSGRNWSPVWRRVAVLDIVIPAAAGSLCFPLRLTSHTDILLHPSLCPPRGLTSPLQKCPIPQPHDRGPQTLPLKNSFFAHLSPQMWSTYCFSADTFLLYYISGGNESFTSAPEGSTFSSSESWVMSTGSSLAGKKPNFCFSFN